MNNHLIPLILSLLLLFPSAVQGQVPNLTEGIYFTFDQFRQNRPAITWDKLRGSIAVNDETRTLQIEDLMMTETGAIIPRDTLWGLTVEGEVYVRVPADTLGKDLSIFAGLYEWGQLTRFSYEALVAREVEISAYNPLTGKPFRKGKVVRKDYERQHALLDLSTGEMMLLQPKVLTAYWRQYAPSLADRAEELIGDERDRTPSELQGLVNAYNTVHEVTFPKGE